ncbi:hypothetical protein [Virgibacillus proomii]|jgi:hypothetical protein|uniref:hypothetical protein n=1 Tax=Virgibacillus proomii TaxID=84407 RepID=UPI000985A726|nr:hypothetical protein [Virgibacillus proomii]
MKEDYRKSNAEAREQTDKKYEEKKQRIYKEYEEKKKLIELVARSQKVKLQILNGANDLGYSGRRYEMLQFNAGEVQFIVNGKLQDEVFTFIKFERTENIKKSALDVAGWTFAGSMLWGKTGALAAGLGDQAGKDKSTAALFLLNKETQKKIMLIIKCDSKTLEKLSRFTFTQEEFEQTQTSSADKYVQLEKIAKLKEQGVLTEVEFQREKERILSE